MWKRLLIIFLAVLICMPAAFGRRKSKKSGDIEKNVYTDNTYEFTMTLQENWKVDLQKPNDLRRMELVQKDYEIPPELMQFPHMAQTPTLEIYVSEEGDKMTPTVFVDSLTSLTFTSKVKKEIMKNIISLEEKVTFDGFTQTQKNILEIDEKQAMQWVGSAKYTKDLGMGETIPRSYGVAFITIKNGPYIVTFALKCEEMFLADVFKEMKQMAESVKWPEG